MFLCSIQPLILSQTDHQDNYEFENVIPGITSASYDLKKYKKLPGISQPGRSAGMTGFEPAISGLTGQRVSPLHYTPKRSEVYHVVGSNVKT
jgi:hypothetical protein